MENNLSKRFLTFAFLTFGIFPLLPVKLIGLPVIIFFISAVFTYFKFPKTKLNQKGLLIILIPYLIFLISAFYSEDTSNGLRKVFEPRLSLLIVPISFYLLNKDLRYVITKSLTRFQLMYCISAGALCLLYFGNLLFVDKPINPHFSFPSGFFFRSAAVKMPLWELEPVYFSYILVIAYVINYRLYYTKQIKLLYYLILMVIYLVVLLLMTSKIALFFVMLFSVIQVLFRIRKIKYRLGFLLLIIISSYPILSIPSIKYEIEEIQYFFKGEKRAKNDTGDIRYRVMISSFELAKYTNPLIGTGIGDLQEDLNKIFLKRDYKDLLQKKYDPHNQYMSMFLGTGLLGVFGLFFHLVYLIKLSIRKRFFTYVWLIFFMVLQMFTETLLERQIPVIIYAFIISMVVFLPSKLKSQSVCSI